MSLENGSTGADVPLVSRARFAFDMQHAPLWERETGKLVARSGHRGTWARSTTLAGLNHSTGTYTAAQTIPGYDWKSVLGVNQLCLTMDVNDTLTFPLTFGAEDHTGWLRFVETGNVATSGATLYAVSPSDPTSGMRFYIDTTGSFYRLTYHNGTTSVSATLAAAPTAGQTVDLRWQWNANGSVMLAQSINGAAETSNTSSTLTRVAYASGALVRLNRRGLTQNPGKASYRALTIAYGFLTAAQIQGLW